MMVELNIQCGIERKIENIVDKLKKVEQKGTGR